jgi:hypothetical protein
MIHLQTNWVKNTTQAQNQLTRNLTKTSAETSTNILALLQSDSDFDSNIRIVALSLSFPAIIRTPQSDSWNSRYDRFRADCYC